jgi:hypothetical protein
MKMGVLSDRSWRVGVLDFFAKPLLTDLTKTFQAMDEYNTQELR